MPEIGGSQNACFVVGMSVEPPISLCVRCTSVSFMRLPSLFPPTTLCHPPHKVDQTQKHGDFDQRPNGRSECLIAVGTISRHCHSDRELEVIACGSETLSGGELVSEPKTVGHPHGRGENDDKVDDQRRGDADHRNDLVDDLPALACEEDEDGVKQADERPWREVLQEYSFVPVEAGDPLHCETSDYGSTQGDAEKYGNADGDGRVGDRDFRFRVAYDVDEEDRHWRVQHHLQD